MTEFPSRPRPEETASHRLVSSDGRISNSPFTFNRVKTSHVYSSLFLSVPFLKSRGETNPPVDIYHAGPMPWKDPL